MNIFEKKLAEISWNHNNILCAFTFIAFVTFITRLTRWASIHEARFSFRTFRTTITYFVYEIIANMIKSNIARIFLSNRTLYARISSCSIVSRWSSWATFTV